MNEGYVDYICPLCKRTLNLLKGKGKFYCTLCLIKSGIWEGKGQPLPPISAETAKYVFVEAESGLVKTDPQMTAAQLSEKEDKEGTAFADWLAQRIEDRHQKR